MATKRTKRVSDLLVREVASIIQKDVKDPRIGLITITGADVSPDLRRARVYYTVLGDDEQRGKTQQGLEKAAGYIRRAVGAHLTLKSTPELEFKYDVAFETGLRMEQLLSGNVDERADDDERSEED